MKKVYLAGGWFTPQQDEEHTKIYNLIKDSFEVYNPRLEGEKITKKYKNFNDASSEVLIGNIEGIKNSDVVLVIYDYKDTGTIWESGFAYSNKKPIVYYSETNGNKSFNLMLAKTGIYVTNETELLNSLNDTLTYEFKNVYNTFKGEIE